MENNLKKCLITGIGGFVGSVLKDELNESMPELELHGLIRSGELTGKKDYFIHEMDIRDTVSVSTLIQSIQPDLVFHLAAQPFVPKAILDPWGTLDINVKGTLNILESLKNLNRPCRIIYISSADVYGRQSKDSYPLLETILPNPINPYSASKLAAEIYCRQYASVSKFLDIMVARPFNHIGVGQRKEFVIPNFCQQIIESSKSSNPEIKVGDISSTRDFLDVRDVVKAYITLAKKGVSGELYNICSGEETSIESALNIIIQQSGKNIKITKDPSRFREAETPRLFGNNDKLKALGWQKKYKLSESLKEIYQNLLETN